MQMLVSVITYKNKLIEQIKVELHIDHFVKILLNVVRLRLNFVPRITGAILSSFSNAEVRHKIQ